MTNLMGTTPGDDGRRHVDNVALSTAVRPITALGVGDRAQRARPRHMPHAAMMARHPQSTALITTTSLFINLQMGKALL